MISLLSMLILSRNSAEQNIMYTITLISVIGIPNSEVDVCYILSVFTSFVASFYPRCLKVRVKEKGNRSNVLFMTTSGEVQVSSRSRFGARRNWQENRGMLGMTLSNENLLGHADRLTLRVRLGGSAVKRCRAGLIICADTAPLEPPAAFNPTGAPPPRLNCPLPHTIKAVTCTVKISQHSYSFLEKMFI